MNKRPCGLARAPQEVIEPLMMGGGEGLVVGGERWEASVLVYWCACVCFFFLPVDAPGPVHQIAELCSLVFGLENKNSHTKKYSLICMCTA